MPSLVDNFKRLVPRSGPLADPLVQRILLGVFVVILTAVPLVLQAPPIGLTQGSPSPRTFRANRTVQFVDEMATELAREDAANAVVPVYVFDAEALAASRDDVTAYFDEAISAAAEHSDDATAVAEVLGREFPDLDEELVEITSVVGEAELREVRGSAEQLITTVLNSRFTAEELPDAVVQMRESAASLPFSGEVRDVIAAVIETAMRPTLVLDPTATEAAREAASEAVVPVVIAKQAGENIVQRGEIVTAEHLEIIKQLGLLDQGSSVLSLMALLTLAAMMITAGGAYVWRYDRAVWDSFRDLLIISSLFVGMVWVTRGILWLLPEVSLYFLPVPLAAMLATLLISAREGMLVAILTSLAAVLLGFSGGAQVVAMLVWSMFSVVAISFMTERRQLFYVGGFLIMTGSAVGFTAAYASGLPLDEALSAGVAGAVGGMLSAVLGYGLLPFFEHIFGVTTDIRLLELSNPANPLLRELMVKAPGTYSHSIVTANLAEASADAIGANPLLARVGAYYHDIGKTRRPGFFVENQAGSLNPHDTTAPSLSAIIITAHVREGIDMARKHRLPDEIVDIIRQHHGTSLVSYFYNKATNESAQVYEGDFRYDGERPQSREAALVMLADSAEASVRAIKQPTPPRIEATVRKVVAGKMADGQLDDADLTLADIEKTIKVCSSMLASMYHPRIEYPDTEPGRSESAHQHHEPSRS